MVEADRFQWEMRNVPNCIMNFSPSLASFRKIHWLNPTCVALPTNITVLPRIPRYLEGAQFRTDVLLGNFIFVNFCSL